MSSQGDGKPLGNEGEPTFLAEPVYPQPIEWDDKPVAEGYDLLEAIIREQQRNLFAAIASNVQRHGFKDRIPDMTVAGTAVMAGVLAGYPVLGAAIGGVTALFRSLRDTFRIRRNKHEADNQAVVEVRMFLLYAVAHLTENASMVAIGKVPHVKEFKNLWLVSAWRLVHYLKGYNTRVNVCLQALNNPECTSDQRKAAVEILNTMRWCSPRLHHALRALEDLYADLRHETKGRIEKMGMFNDRVEELDPFKDKEKCFAGFDWLPLPHDSLIRAELPARAEKDRTAIQSIMEINTQQIDLDLAKLESAHGPTVDEILQNLKKKNDTDPEQ